LGAEPSSKTLLGPTIPGVGFLHASPKQLLGSQETILRVGNFGLVTLVILEDIVDNEVDFVGG
jgi:hypothetical protein